MSDSDEEQMTPEDLEYFKSNAQAASFLLKGQGLAQKEEKVSEKKRKKLLKQERQLARQMLEDADERPRQSKDWKEAEEKERRQGLPIKLADGTIKKVLRQEPLPVDDGEDQPSLSNRARKKLRKEQKEPKDGNEDKKVVMGPELPPDALKSDISGPKEDQKKKVSALQESEFRLYGLPRLCLVNPPHLLRQSVCSMQEKPAEKPPMTCQEKKIVMASLGSKIMRSPEQHVSEVSRLHEFCQDDDSVIVKLAMLSETALFGDILPEYRIRLPTEKEKEMKVSKEVAAQRKFESTLLGAYQRFLQFLEGAGRKYENATKELNEAGNTEAVKSSVLSVSVKCLATLLKRHPHFNFSKNIMQSLVRRVESPVDYIAETAVSALQDHLQQSQISDSVKDCVTSLADLVKRKDRNIRPQVLKVFLKLKITSDMLEGDGKKKKTSEDDLENDMEEGRATLAKAETKRLATTILDSVLVVYFRVLKMSPVVSELLPPVLEGLSRFAHLVNVDFFSDLLQAIKSLVVAEESGQCELSTKSQIHCILCVFLCLKNQGEVWDLDLQDFYDVLFQAIPRLVGAPEEEDNVPLLLEAVRMTLYDLRQLSTDRVAGFVKRLLSAAMHMSPARALATYATVRQLLVRYPKAKRLLDTDHACVGVYNADVANAELSNALASTAWELSLSSKSYHPHSGKGSFEIAGMATELATDEDRQRSLLTNRAPHLLLRQYDTSQCGFNPAIPLPKKHPLETLFAKLLRKRSKKEDKKQKQDATPLELFVENPPKAYHSKFLQSLKSEGGRDAAAAMEDFSTIRESFRAHFSELPTPPKKESTSASQSKNAKLIKSKKLIQKSPQKGPQVKPGKLLQKKVNGAAGSGLQSQGNKRAVKKPNKKLAINK